MNIQTGRFVFRFHPLSHQEVISRGHGAGNGYILLKSDEMHLMKYLDNSFYRGRTWNSTLEKFNKCFQSKITGYDHVVGFDTCHYNSSEAFPTVESVFQHLEEVFSEALEYSKEDHHHTHLISH